MNDPNAPSTPTKQRQTFTGIQRRATRRSVKVADFVAKYVITVGGIGVTLFFAAIILFLVWVVIPLFKSPSVRQALSVQIPTGQTKAIDAATTTAERRPAMGVDDAVTLAWVLNGDGVFNTYRIGGGELVNSEKLSDIEVTATSNNGEQVALGRADGTVIAGRIGYDAETLDHVSDVQESLNRGETAVHGKGVALMTPAGPRVVTTRVELTEPLAVTKDNPTAVRLVDSLSSDQRDLIAARLDDGRTFLNVVSKRKNLMTGKVTSKVAIAELPRPAYTGGAQPLALLLGLNGRNVFLVYTDGHCVRYNTDEPASAYIAEEVDLLPDAAATVSSVRMLVGNRTMIVADAKGGVSGWFPAPFADAKAATTKDGEHLVAAHVLKPQAGAVTAIATSSRDRQFITGDAKGHVALRHMTSGTTQATVNTTDNAAVTCLAMSPKNDALVVLDAAHKLSVFNVDNPHPEGGMAALFMPIHYEGYAGPDFIYQSSAATDDAEPKLSLVPLIFGTLKATVYALLFAIPVAIAAAIYSSEFMHPQVRSVVKPVVEMMASLPSVVLGFIAALVLAPIIEQTVPAVLTMFIAIPIGVMLFGFIWQIIPPDMTARLGALMALVMGWATLLVAYAQFGAHSLAGVIIVGALLVVAVLLTAVNFGPERLRDAAVPYIRFVVLVQLVIVAAALSYVLGPVVESILFSGDFLAWLGKRVGSGVPGWVVLLAPLFTIAIVIVFNLRIRRLIPIYSGAGNRMQIAIADLARFAVIGALGLGAAYLVGVLFTNGFGWDLRDDWVLGQFRLSPIGPYQQRNALIVGMIMGFAIIPIIYTVSEDALSSVPASLRSAALGAGATPWQTAIRVVLPVAISGIFSAVMIGLGRAAGETMIVLMAAGNTALFDANIFNGLRSMSANIATELPEAVVDSTHYRILFLSGLVLFALTFLVNTTAEIIRVRFRKRAYQL